MVADSLRPAESGRRSRQAADYRAHGRTPAGCLRPAGVQAGPQIRQRRRASLGRELVRSISVFVVQPFDLTAYYGFC